MVSGMRNGKLAENEVLLSLEIDNKNIMAQIENARRFINKPRLLGGSIKKGIEILNTVIKEFPELEKGYLNLGIVYYEIGEGELAAETFNKLLEINPDNPEAKFFVNHLVVLE
jgi:tetratricopeptide (TPR) repeat protein